MTYRIQKVFLSALVCIFLSISVLFAFSTSALAHGGVEHSDEESVAELAQMEQMIKLLSELLLLMQALKIQQGYAPVVTSVIQKTIESDASPSNTTETTKAQEEKKLVIEVETHNSKTHVHARYIDKPEDMFFVDASINDETALIDAIEARTGLSYDEIKVALVYYK